MRCLKCQAWVMGLVMLAGCGKKAADTPGVAHNPASPTAAIPNSVDTPAPPAPPNPNLSFAEAVIQDSPSNQLPPPDRTRAGAATGQLRQKVQQEWDTIKFNSPSGKSLVYIVTMRTEFGAFRVQMLPEVAPNHVRNFLALIKAGYYDGLGFEHLISEQGDTPDDRLEMVEAGCPLGTGEPGIAHLGYWLRPEVSEGILHEPGSFGAVHDENPETAATRFYVTLTKAPAMDGNFTVFGKVVEGLDVVRTISKQPRAEGSAVQPAKPTVILSICIETQEVR